MVKNPPVNSGDPGDSSSIPGLRRSLGGGNDNPPQYSCRKSHGQRSPEGYSPRGHKESDTTGHTHTKHMMLMRPLKSIGI